ncbi:MAG: HK97 gp10 family phage protein [Chloroflexi bacterium]|nr:HK97 gp10 family phage protein [Chloroflexota bacterium]
MPTFNAPLQINAQRIETNVERLVHAWAQEILRRFQTEVVPIARERLPVRTGRLFRSVRVEVKQWGAVVHAEFYQRFLEPTFEAILVEEWRKRRGTITRQAFRVARAKTGPIFGG